jgi:hypothetical protein
MLARAAELLSQEWRSSLLFVAVILILGSLALFWVQGVLFKGLLFFYGIFVYNSFFLYIGMALRCEKVAAPIKFILFGKDKARYDFYILLFFYVAIFLILAGPYILFQSLLILGDVPCFIV